jgi:hypothetical protein
LAGRAACCTATGRGRRSGGRPRPERCLAGAMVAPTAGPSPPGKRGKMAPESEVAGLGAR